MKRISGRGRLSCFPPFFSSSYPLSSLSGRAPIVLDTHLTPEVAQSHNLILIGDHMTNKWIDQIQNNRTFNPAQIPPIRTATNEKDGSVSVVLNGSGCSFEGQRDLGLLYTVPSWDSTCGQVLKKLSFFSGIVCVIIVVLYYFHSFVSSITRFSDFFIIAWLRSVSLGGLWYECGGNQENHKIFVFQV